MLGLAAHIQVIVNLMPFEPIYVSEEEAATAALSLKVISSLIQLPKWSDTDYELNSPV